MKNQPSMNGFANVVTMKPEMVPAKARGREGISEMGDGRSQMGGYS